MVVTTSIPSHYSNPSGLHRRYSIKKVDENNKESDPDTGAIYFVLRLDAGGDENHVRACHLAVLRYAEAVESKQPQLAYDLRTMVAAQAGIQATNAVLQAAIIPEKKS